MNIHSCRLMNMVILLLTEHFNMKVIAVLVCLLVLVQSTPTVPQYKLFEYCDIAVEKHYQNPFNYEEVNVVATIQTQSKNITIDGFYYQNYTRTQSTNGNEILTVMGSPKWCIRYTPITVEVHKVYFTITDKDGTRNIGNEVTFDVSKAEETVPGFVIVGNDRVHFIDNHTRLLYIPCGENVCWPSSMKGTYDYDKYFTNLSLNGANYARLWLTDPSFIDLAVEIANFNISMPNTWRLDYIVQLAEKLSIRLLMCTESFNCFSSVPKMPGFWDKSCFYNKKFGGILDKPEDFFTDEGARNDYKMRLRYLISRYSYSTSVFAWEFFNEVDLTDHYDSKTQVNWIKEMAQYVRSIDVNEHMMTTSFSRSDGDDNVYQLPDIDFTMTHNYGSSDIFGQTSKYPAAKQKKFNKPSYVAEFGVADNSQADKKGVSLENGLWAPLFNFGAGTCMTWWWDSWVDPYHLYPVFKNVSKLINDKLVYMSNIQVWDIIDASVSDSELRMYGMESEDYKMILVNDPCYTWKNGNNNCNWLKNTSITLKQCKEGSRYGVTWYGSIAAVSTDTIAPNVTCHDGKIPIQLPTYQHNIAVFVELM